MISGVRYVIWQLIRFGIAGRLLVELADRKEGVYTIDMVVRLQAPGPAEGHR
jgi:hypothetical protein